MDSTFIATSSTEGLKPLGTAPQRSYELLVSSLNAEQAALFAEPVHSDYGDKVDWYSEQPGRTQPLSTLEDADQVALRQRLEALVGEVRDIAEAYLQDEDDTERQRLGEALQNALEIPSEDSIYARISADGVPEPILINWAWVEDRQRAVRGVLSGSDTRTEQPAPAAGAGATVAGAALAQDQTRAADLDDTRARAAAATGAPLLLWWLFWIGWLLLALMIAAILLLLIAPCGVRLPGAPNYCATGEPEASEDLRYTMVLRDQVAILERQIGIADRACQPEPGIPDFLPRAVLPPPLTPPEPVVTQQTEAIDDRLGRAGAEIGELTFSLVWDGPDDLDLEVTCPAGDRLFWGVRSACGGRLDIDTGVGSAALEPVENIYFDAPVAGEYSVRITMPTSRRNGAPQPFQLLVRDRTNVQLLDGVVSGRDREWSHIHRFGGN